MSVTYSSLLRLNVITTGTEDGTWGDITNTNIGTLLEQAIAGSTTIDTTSGNVTLTVANGATDQSRYMALRVTGTPGTTRSVIAPATSKVYIIANGSNASVTIKTSTSTGLTVPSGDVYLVYYDTGVADFVYVGASATSTNTANKLVLRDSSGNFAAGTITATTFSGDLNGTINTATTATTQTASDNTTKVATTAFVKTAVDNAKNTLGTMALQNANNVNITGGAVSGTTVNGNIVGTNSVGARTVQSVSAGTPTGGNDGDIVYQY